MKLYPNKLLEISGRPSLYLHSELGKMVKVTAIFDNVNECNDYLEVNKDEGLIHESGTLYICAKLTGGL